VHRVPYLRGCTSALRGGVEGAGPRACSLMVTFIKPDVVHCERTGRADDCKREQNTAAEPGRRACVHKRVARRVRKRDEGRRGGSDEGGEREDRARQERAGWTWWVESKGKRTRPARWWYR
jgi:hypothetical protein